nr:PREDICTED: tigger transposable element-derived protein 6-like [Bemisia tabaci]
MVGGAWDKVTPVTIRHCFKKAGFPVPDSDDSSSDSDAENEEVVIENVPSEQEQFDQLRNFFGADQSISLENFIDAEEEAPVAPSLTLDEIIEQHGHGQDCRSSSEDEEEPEFEKVSTAVALGAVTALRNFAAQHDLDSEYQRSLNLIEEKTQLLGLQIKKQTSITDFFTTK